MPRHRASTRRRIAVATWSRPKDGRIYTRAAIDAGPLIRYVEGARARTGAPVTITHVVGAAVGRLLRAEPAINARVFAGRIQPFRTCDVGFAVDIASGGDLAPFAVRAVDTKTPVDVAVELSAGVGALRGGRSGHTRVSNRIARRTPTVLMKPVLALAGVLTGGLGIAAFGQPGFPLGGAFVSNVGSLGLREAFLAPVPFARCPLYIAIGAIADAAAVVAGEVVVRPEVVLTATADHRLIDGAQAGRMLTVLEELLAEPAVLDRVDAVVAPTGTGGQAARRPRHR